jgi:hypothetical protein
MVNIPYRSSEALIAGTIEARFEALRRVGGAMLLALFAAVVLGSLLRSVPADAGGAALRDLVPIGDAVAAASFTA